MREVNINGKTIKLETGMAPKEPAFRGRPKSDLRLLLEEMRPGESAFLPITAERVQAANLTTLSRSIGRNFCYRSESNGVRIYCAEPAGLTMAKSKASMVARIRQQVSGAASQ